ncbi:MAG: class I SAM-dependent methyltransferase [Rhizobacter sp.]|nr:class I SAM-dependent methyltransferase [Rhizobacter sp.]
MSTDATTLAERFRGVAAAPAPARGRAFERRIDRAAERLLRSRLAELEHGTVSIVQHGRSRTYGRATSRCALHATLHVHDDRFYAEAAFGGSVGAGEAFIAGAWDCDDLTALVRILLVNRGVLEGLETGVSRLAEWTRRALHALARNTRPGSRRNIAAHYDVGNDFFELFLDPTMMYSCAFFEAPGISLEQAQHAKLDRLCRKLDLRPDDHLLEIGTGWGALALHAAGRYGCRVTTTTISRQQHALARERIAAAGLEGRITLRLDDYRDLDGRYDKLVSVEMIEAVGHQYFDVFFRRCNELLAPGGTMVLQSITIDDRHYAAARDSVDFIKRNVFPGCCIPSVGALTASIVGASRLRIVDLEDIGPHYATTLAAWRERLVANAAEIRARGYPEELLRLWRFYLSYCEGGFAERTLANVQLVLQDTATATRPTARV